MILKYMIFVILAILVATNLIIFKKLSKTCDHVIIKNKRLNQTENKININTSNLIERIDILNDDIIDFEEFDNRKGSKKHIIPNAIHLIFLNTTQIPFYQAINIYSIYLNQKPDRIYIHCDICNFTGYYWNQINLVSDLRNKIKINKIILAKTIFDNKYSSIQHKVDVLKLLVLMNYGGIYLDNDVFLIKSINELRRYEMVMSYENIEETKIANQILMAHKNARLLKAFYDGYRFIYKPNDFYYKSGILPKDILKNHTKFAHTVFQLVGTYVYHRRVFQEYWPSWRKLYCIHLMIKGFQEKDKYISCNQVENSFIKNLKNTYGEMVRDLYKKLNFNLE